MQEDWIDELLAYLEAHGYAVVAVHSKQEAITALQTRTDWLGLVAISDWMMSDANGEPGLLKLTKDKIPAVSIITPATWKYARDRMLDELILPVDEYVSAPFGADTLIARMQKVGIANSQSPNH